MNDNSLLSHESSPQIDQQIIHVMKTLSLVMKTTKDTLEPALSGLVAIQQYFEETIAPFIESIRKSYERFAAILEILAESGRAYRALIKLSNSQFVVWESIPKLYVDQIINCDCVNKELRLFYEKEKYNTAFETAQKCSEHQFVRANKYVFSQAINAFRAGQCNLAVVGLTVTIDGALSAVSSNATTNIAKRTNQLLNKLEKTQFLEDSDFQVFSLLISFQKSMELFSEYSDFSKPEPKTLNRHWIAHGRSYRKKTKIDCVKLINMLYGIILIDKLTKEEETYEL